MVPIGCPETSARYFHCMLGNNPEERSSQFTPWRKPEITHHCDLCLYRNSNPGRQTLISIAGCIVKQKQYKCEGLCDSGGVALPFSFLLSSVSLFQSSPVSKSLCCNAFLFISSFLSDPEFRAVRTTDMHSCGLAKRSRI
jgi:hypothetical protein